jgi:hypothetical protein
MHQLFLERGYQRFGGAVDRQQTSKGPDVARGDGAEKPIAGPRSFDRPRRGARIFAVIGDG